MSLLLALLPGAPLRKFPLAGSGDFPLSTVAIVIDCGSNSEAVEEGATRLRVEDVVWDGMGMRYGRDRRRLEVYE